MFCRQILFDGKGQKGLQVIKIAVFFLSLRFMWQEKYVNKRIEWYLLLSMVSFMSYCSVWSRSRQFLSVATGQEMMRLYSIFLWLLPLQNLYLAFKRLHFCSFALSTCMFLLFLLFLLLDFWNIILYHKKYFI